MIRYIYKARDENNRKISGMVDAIDQRQALKILRSRHFLVVYLQVKKTSFLAELKSTLQKVKKDDILTFTRSLSTMITAGLNLAEALNIIYQQSSLSLQKVISQISKEVEGGNSLYTALSHYPRLFSPMYLALIRSGESAGVLDKIMMRLAETLEKQKEFQAKVKGALIYPMIVVVGMIAVSIIMIIFVIPKITSMFVEFNLQLPMATRILMFISSAMTDYWYLLTALGFAIFIFTKKWYQTEIGRINIDDLLIRIPIIGMLNEKVMLTEMTRTLSLLVAGGVSIIDSLNIVSEVAANKVYEITIKKIAKEVEKGGSLAATFNKTEVFPPILSQMISVGEETGKLDEVLLKVSKHFEMEAEYAIKGLTSAIEPLMIILLGAGVGFLVIAIIMPIYQLTSSF